MFKKPSGSQFKKRAKEKEEREEQVLAKVPKINNFFLPKEVRQPSTITSDFDCTQETLDVDKSGRDLSYDEQNKNEDELTVNECLVSSFNEVQDPPKGEDQYTVLADPAFWKIDEVTREYFAKRGFKQNKEYGFSMSEREYKDKKRYCNESFFKKRLQNGELINRDFLVYSPSKGFLICAYCKLYSNASSNFTDGFNDWKNASSLLQSHENSPIHRKATLSFISRSNPESRVDSKVIEACETEAQYWKEVFKRVIATVKYLATRGLPFRGSDYFFGSCRNGAYLGALELIAEFDPFFSQHIVKHGNRGKGSTSYLSHFTCDEFITIMGETVLQKITDQIKESKYYSIVLDSTPDVAHVDQLTFVIRYVQSNGEPVERFLKFLPNIGHKSEQMTTAVLTTLEILGIDIKDCRGQSYDNAANMSGTYSGLQAQIKGQNELAEYIPCFAHSLNLVGVAAAEACDKAVAFFHLVQAVYNFFSASTYRWVKLKEILKADCPVVKSLSATRWSARADALKALLKSLLAITALLTKISEDINEKPACRQEARGLARKLQKSENVFLLVLWEEIMNKFYIVSQALQSETIDIGNVTPLFKSLEHYLLSCRENYVQYLSKTEALTKSTGKDEWNSEVRKRKRKPFFDEEKEPCERSDINFDAKESFKTGTFLVIVDRLVVELQKRSESYDAFAQRFGFLLNLTATEDKTIVERSTDLLRVYKNDLQDSFPDECVQFKSFLQHHTSYMAVFQHEPDAESKEKQVKEKKKRSFSYLLHIVKDGNLQSIFPNLDIILRIVLSMAVTNCAGERSFSTLKRVKNYQRNSMGDVKLNALAILAIESDLTSTLNFQEVLDKFSKTKQRRKV